MNCIASLIIYYSNILNFDAAIVYSVIGQESKFDSRAVGNLGELGLGQLRPEFNREYTKNELLNKEINIKVTIERLKEAKKGCKNKENLNYLVCYNHGITGGNKIFRPENDEYVKNVTKYAKEFEKWKVLQEYVIIDKKMECW